MKTSKRVLTAIAVIVLVAVLAGVIYWYYFVYKREDRTAEWDAGTVETGGLTVRFLELGNGNAGDCILIKTGNTEVLIDAGSKQESAATLVPKIKEYCTDGKLEYVIATHAHTDHIGAFYSTQSRKGIFDSFECGVIIDFPKTNKTNVSANTVIGRYYAARDREVEEGAVHYTALQCWNQTDGAQRSYALAEGISFEILYQRYYEEVSPDLNDENNYSVCTLFTQGDYHYLFTGDLEAEGEESLVESNELPHCKLYKAGHHGSKTSSSEKLLQAITPETVCICCCAGSDEYTATKNNQFPTQDAIDRLSKYTENIYVTTLSLDGTPAQFTSMNGDITVTSNGVDFSVRGSHNDIILKDTEWFRKNRVWKGI